MNIQEILEAHTQSIRNGRCFCEDRGPKRTGIEHATHVAVVLEKHMQEREAKAWDMGQDSVALHHDIFGASLEYEVNPYRTETH